MATGKVFKVSVFGRVAYPATLVPASNDTYFLNFGLLVDGLAKEKNDRKIRKSGRINCSYLVKGNPAQDPVAVILNNVYNAKTGQGNLGGQTYKSVEVLVEGSLSLTANEGSSYYVGLDYCSVTVTDNNLLGLYKQLAGQAQQQQQPTPQPQQQPTPQQQLPPQPQVGVPVPQLATTAPNTMPPPQPVMQPAPSAMQQQQPPPVAQMQTVPTQVAVAAPPQAALAVNTAEAAAMEASRTLAQNSQVLNSTTVAVQQPSASVKQLLEGDTNGAPASQPNAAPAFTGQNNPV